MPSMGLGNIYLPWIDGFLPWKPLDSGRSHQLFVYVLIFSIVGWYIPKDFLENV